MMRYKFVKMDMIPVTNQLDFAPARNKKSHC